jgi:hypothetical protein
MLHGLIWFQAGPGGGLLYWCRSCGLSSEKLSCYAVTFMCNSLSSGLAGDVQEMSLFTCRHVKGSRYTPWRRFGWEEVQLLLFLNLGTRRGWVVTITPRPRFTPWKRAPGTHCIGGWVGPRAGLDAEVRGKILCLCRRSNSGRPVRSQTLYWATPACQRIDL